MCLTFLTTCIFKKRFEKRYWTSLEETRVISKEIPNDERLLAIGETKVTLERLH